MDIVFFGLTLTSSWGNGHAGTYRGLLRGLHRRGHRCYFFERDAEWYAAHRDLPHPAFAQTTVYSHWREIRARALARCRAADAVIVGSYCADAIPVLDALLGRGGPPVFFYDIDTPITLQQLRHANCPYLRSDHIPALDAYLSFTGGPVLTQLRQRWGARCVFPLYCVCDEDAYSAPLNGTRPPFHLSYMGTYAPDRQAKFTQLLTAPARRLPNAQLYVAGPMYPDVEHWPANILHHHHLPPGAHPAFYHSARMTLNLTRQAMVEAGYSPSVRLFEAAFSGAPIVTDPWPGLAGFFTPGAEILVASSTADMCNILSSVSDAELRTLAAAARDRVFAQHTSLHRARELEDAIASCRSQIEAPTTSLAGAQY